MHCIYIVSVYVCVSHKILNHYIYLVLIMVVSLFYFYRRQLQPNSWQWLPSPDSNAMPINTWYSCVA